MREMKDSGVASIGMIPVEWKTIKLKFLFGDGNEGLKIGPFGSAMKGKTLESGEYKIYNQAHLINNDFSLNRHFVSEETFQELRNYEVKPGDVLFSMMGTIGKCRIMPEGYPKGIMDSHLLKAGLNLNIVHPQYFVYAYDKDCSSQVIEQLLYSSNGTIMNGLNSTILKNVKIAMPYSLGMQRKIVNYLDTKSSKIDEIIEKQQVIIEKLKEYKLSTITEVVTSGLNQKREMKDSHVLSIGRIPTNWDVSKLKYLFGNGDNGLKIGPFGSAIKGKTLESGLYKIYNQAHLINNDFSLNRHFVSEDTFNDLTAYEVKPGDVLFSMMGTIGKCQIMPKGYPKGIMDSHLLKARLNEKVIPEFFIYAYDKDFSNQVIQQLLYTSNGTIMNGLNSTILKNVYIALPPLEEQEEIVEFLNNFTKNIDDRIGAKTKIVEKLQEYKKSLIYEVVTGKKEV